MLTANQIQGMFPDLADTAVESALALVHQRFSTNTFPSWPLAHPYRFVAHNGEINTLRGNINWMKAREALLQCESLGDDLKKILPIIREGGSDSAIFDNVLELLVMGGRSLPHAILMMIPEPWQNNDAMDPELRAFYEYHASLMEPWDGPASLAFTDGTVIGAVLDRNGLRPSRYYVTRDGLVVLASEVGVLDIPPADVVIKERLHPGRIFLVDTAQGRIISDEEIKRELAREYQYAEWLMEHLIPIEEVAPAPFLPAPDHATVLRRQQAFGYTQEDIEIILRPMALGAEEPVGSMGTDTPLAVLSQRPRLLYDYFKQLFAQVTNPPLDAIRDDRPRAQPARARAGIVPADRHQIPDHRQRGGGEDPPHRGTGIPVGDAADAVSGGRRGRRTRTGARPAAGAGTGGRVRRAYRALSLRPRGQREAGADPEPSRDRRRAPSPGP
jgi:glutamate synthase (ferredoxin)